MKINEMNFLLEDSYNEKQFNCKFQAMLTEWLKIQKSNCLITEKTYTGKFNSS